ncbi:hypothetical protein GGS20DRAFT_599789 [Poronia punctata]|nr:hypothetical protein GGS20DRAFT_599789 [Poronia punctata]
MATTTIFDSRSPSRPQIGGNSGILNLTTSKGPVTSTPDHRDKDEQGNSEDARQLYRLLNKEEWLQFCRGMGILKDEEGDEVIRITSRLWPPKGFRDGLYSDVLYERAKYTYLYYSLSSVTWILMLVQLALSAVLTALGATSKQDGTPITAIAAINTSIAGILALLHNSGVPHRHRSDRNEFHKIEEHIKSIVDTGLVPSTYSVNDALAECFDMFATAVQTVQNNAPSTYTQAPGARPVPATSAGNRTSQIQESKR